MTKPDLKKWFPKQHHPAEPGKGKEGAGQEPCQCSQALTTHVFSSRFPRDMGGLSAFELALHQMKSRAPLEEVSTVQGQFCSEIPLLEFEALALWQERIT